MIPSILQDNVRELAEHSGYVPSPPLKPVQSILKSCYIPSPFLARKPSLVHMHHLATPLKNLQCLLSPPKSKAKANVRKATSFFIPLNDEKSQSLLKIHSKPSLIPAFRRQLTEKYNVPLQRKASRIPVLQARSNTQILPLIKARQSTITKHHEKMTSGSRKVSLHLPLSDVKECRSQY